MSDIEEIKAALDRLRHSESHLDDDDVIENYVELLEKQVREHVSIEAEYRRKLASVEHDCKDYNITIADLRKQLSDAKAECWIIIHDTKPGHKDESGVGLIYNVHASSLDILEADVYETMVEYLGNNKIPANAVAANFIAKNLQFESANYQEGGTGDAYFTMDLDFIKFDIAESDSP